MDKKLQYKDLGNMSREEQQAIPEDIYAQLQIDEAKTRVKYWKKRLKEAIREKN